MSVRVRNAYLEQIFLLLQLLLLLLLLTDTNTYAHKRFVSRQGPSALISDRSRPMGTRGLGRSFGRSAAAAAAAASSQRDRNHLAQWRHARTPTRAQSQALFQCPTMTIRFARAMTAGRCSREQRMTEERSRLSCVVAVAVVCVSVHPRQFKVTRKLPASAKNTSHNVSGPAGPAGPAGFSIAATLAGVRGEDSGEQHNTTGSKDEIPVPRNGHAQDLDLCLGSRPPCAALAVNLAIGSSPGKCP
uniref:Secreted protein n=1 Tax=Anopheles farauti TaxID=69004 RepID=A0A182QCS9_9DIPT